MRETFVGEPIEPMEGTFRLSEAAIGEPGLPQSFSWRDRQFVIVAVLEKWKEAGDCHHGSGERYVRKHWYRVRTDAGLEMRLYFERQQRSRGSRWRLFTMRNAA